MAVAMAEQVTIDEQEVIYPATDGEPMAETGIHVHTILHLYGALLNYYQRRNDVYIASDMFLYYEKGNPKARRTPDVMVIYGVPSAPERHSFRIWEEGAVPTVIFEIFSRETQQDLVTKSVLYARIGVREYFIFDPLEEYLENTLQGFRLEDKDYVPMVAHDGQLYSEQLGLAMHREGTFLRLVDPITGEKVLSYEEMLAKVDAAEENVRVARQFSAQAQAHAEEETRRAEQEAQRAEQEAQRAVAAEAENLRLRELLATYQSKGADS